MQARGDQYVPMPVRSSITHLLPHIGSRPATLCYQAKGPPLLNIAGVNSDNYPLSWTITRTSLVPETIHNIYKAWYKDNIQSIKRYKSIKSITTWPKYRTSFLCQSTSAGTITHSRHIQQCPARIRIEVGTEFVKYSSRRNCIDLMGIRLLVSQVLQRRKWQLQWPCKAVAF